MYHRRTIICSIRQGNRIPRLDRSPGRVSRPLRESTWPFRSDVSGGVQIGVRLVAALGTSEMRLIGTIGTGDMATARTHLGCIARIDKDNSDAQPGGLVFEHVNQLPEGPGAYHAVEPLGTMDTVANPIQAFEDNHGMLIFAGKVHDLTADFVVDVCHPVRFLALLIFDAIRSVVSLIPLAKVGEMLTSVADGFAIEECDLIWRRDCRDSHDTQVNANKSSTVTDGRRGVFDANGQHHVPVRTALEQLGITASQGNMVTVLLGNAQWKPDVTTTNAGRTTQEPSSVFLAQGIGICTQADTLRTVDFWKGDSSLRSAQAIEGSGQRYGSIHRHPCIVGRKAILLAGWVVDGLVESDTTGGTEFFCGIETKLDCLAKHLGHILQPLALAFRRLCDLDHKSFCTVHKPIIAYSCGCVKSAFLLPINREASSGGIL